MKREESVFSTLLSSFLILNSSFFIQKLCHTTKTNETTFTESILVQ